MNFTAVFVGDMLGEIGLLFSSVLVILSLSRVVSLMGVSVMLAGLSDPGRLVLDCWSRTCWSWPCWTCWSWTCWSFWSWNYRSWTCWS